MTDRQTINQILIRLRKLELQNGGGGGGGAAWGDITGTLSDQTDLQSALDGKQASDADLTSWAAITRASGFDSFTATPSSANLSSLVTDETGSGALVFGTLPALAGFSNTGSVTFSTGSTFTYASGIAEVHRAALLGEILKYDPNAAATRTNPSAYADDDVLAGSNLTSGMWEISFYASFNAGLCGVIPRLLFGTAANVDMTTTGYNLGGYFRGNQAIAALPYTTATGAITMAALAGANSNWQYTGFATARITGNTTLALQYQRNADSAGATIIRRAGAFLRARRIN